MLIHYYMIILTKLLIKYRLVRIPRYKIFVILKMAKRPIEIGKVLVSV